MLWAVWNLSQWVKVCFWVSQAVCLFFLLWDPTSESCISLQYIPRYDLALNNLFKN